MITMTNMKKAAVSFFAISALCLAMTSQAQAVPVDVELSLVWDVSGSISASEYDLQRQGYANAFQSAAVQNAINSGTNQSIAVQVVQFGTNAIVSTGWNLVTSATASNFGTFLSTLGRENTGLSTSIARGIQISAANLLSNNGFEGLKMVMDVSGDGEENVGANPTSVTQQRDLAVASGIIINGLPIVTSSFPNLDDYYTNNVIGGTDAFVQVANGFGDFESAITAKLVNEIGGTTPTPEPSSMILLGSGLIGLVGYRMTKRA
ncbi:DUF1194 domain-containing protein [Candidatus Nitronereus thalassa]|uniref:DUF1194 domain-containing protein n=1 Tax=Candidatus Nitronereus thalassa TaxID=3020898 RepID=A0ABU3KAL1_9BACT|nr:DUF1194 domain-containing protein [Candidatus Nitronereus thalassa]MDT7043525.1 DUF1194 domain-containing protein [Candidatus Nitronereus thalassa]